MAELTPEDAASIAKSVDSAEQSYVSIDKLYKSIFATAQKLNATTGQMRKANELIASLVKKQFASEIKSLEIAKEIGVLSSKKIKDAEKELKFLMSGTHQLMQQEAVLQDISRINDVNTRKLSNQIEIYKQQGKIIKANMLEFSKRFRDPTTGKVESGHAGAAGVGIAQDPKQMLQSLGPWGILIGFIAEVVDGVRMMGGELQKASAESGKFAESFNTTREESQNLFDSQIGLMAQYGITVKEAGQIFGELKNTGIAALGVIPKTGLAMSNLALDVLSFAKATNQSSAEVSEQYASMVRAFGEDVDDLSGRYNEIFTMSAKAASTGIAKVSEMMKAVFSLGDAFKEVGVGLQSVTKLTGSVAKAIKDLGRPGGIDQIQKIASGILGITKASEGWQVFMAKMSGMSGGYAQSLFAIQQRRADFTLPGAKEFDPSKTINAFRGMLAKTTGGIADPATKQLMIEKMGQQVGMDTATTQVFQKLLAGGMDENMAKKDLAKIHKAAVDNNLSTKGMFDILREILVGMIAKPIIFIWKLLARWQKSSEDSGKAQKLIEKLDKPKPESETGELGKIGSKAIGADVTRSGLMMVHAGNTIVPAAKSVPFKDRVRNGGVGNGMNVSFNMMIDEKSLHKQFMKMEQQTLDLLHKQQSANF